MVGWNHSTFRQLLKETILVMDGAYGTLLTPFLIGSETIEELNVRKPDVVQKVHQQYADAGADIIKSNTFGIFHSISRGKMTMTAGLNLIESGVRLLTGVTGKGTAIPFASFGPMTAGIWGYSSDEVAQIRELYRLATEQAISAGIRGILLETFSDLLEMRIAIDAIRHISPEIPVICQFTFQDGSITLSGSGAENAAIMLESLSADVIGVNCSTGPAGILTHVEKLSCFSTGPLSMAPNAGLPVITEGIARYPDVRDEMLALLPRALELGVRIVGTCCGSTPDYTELLRKAIDQLPVEKRVARKRKMPDVISSSHFLIDFQEHKFCAIGERLNLSGNRTFMKRFQISPDQAIIGELTRQNASGFTDAIDINLDALSGKNPSLWEDAVLLLEREGAPILSIDTLYPESMDLAERLIAGKPIYNSTDLTEKRFSKMAKLYHRHRGKIVALLMTGNRLPKTLEQRKEALEILARLLEQYHIPAMDVLVDPLALSLATGVEQFGMVREIISQCGYKTIVGLSNFSHGLAERARMNAFLLGQLMGNGLSAAIVDTGDANICATIRFGNAIFHGKSLIPDDTDRFRFSEPYPEVGTALLGADPDRILDIYEQNRDQFESPYLFLEQIVSPKMEVIGKAFETGELFLPQLIVAGETMKKLLNAWRPTDNAGDDTVKTGPVLFFTVQNDIHDIGKNIVISVLQGFGIPAADGGVDRTPDEIVKLARERGATAVGLSALMTTSLRPMEDSVQRLKTEIPGLPVLVGGAVVTRRYAEEIGADGYGKTAFEAVRLFRKLNPESDGQEK